MTNVVDAKVKGSLLTGSEVYLWTKEDASVPAVETKWRRRPSLSGCRLSCLGAQTSLLQQRLVSFSSGASRVSHRIGQAARVARVRKVHWMIQHVNS